MIAVFIPTVFWAALFYPCGQQNARFGLEPSRTRMCLGSEWDAIGSSFTTDAHVCRRSIRK